jgi:hypothetical protein
MRWSAFLLCAAWSGVAAAAPGIVIDDPMTTAYGAGQTVNGGTFSSAGWTRDSFESQIVYDLGTPVTAGRLVFEMNGVNGVDHGVGGFPDCRAIFAAVDNNASGNIDDPGNESVQFLWAWAMEETDYCNGGPGGFERTNKMKLLVHTTGAAEPGEPMSDPLTWDAATFYQYEIGWDENHAWLHRDGAVVLDIDYPSAPVIMNLRYVFLGTVNRYKSGVKNATYRNLKVYDDGGPVAQDAGSGGSAGSSAADASSEDAAGGAPLLDAGSSGGSSGTPGTGGAGVHGSTESTSDDSGCGCRVPRDRSSPGLFGLLAALSCLAFCFRRRAGSSPAESVAFRP